MNLGNTPVYPCSVNEPLKPHDPKVPMELRAEVSYPGMSQRTYLAALAMQGLLAWCGGKNFPAKDLADSSVEQADALLSALAKPAVLLLLCILPGALLRLL